MSSLNGHHVRRDRTKMMCGLSNKSLRFKPVARKALGTSKARAEWRRLGYCERCLTATIKHQQYAV